MRQPTIKELKAWLTTWHDHCKAKGNIVGMSWIGMVQSALHGHLPLPNNSRGIEGNDRPVRRGG